MFCDFCIALALGMATLLSSVGREKEVVCQPPAGEEAGSELEPSPPQSPGDPRLSEHSRSHFKVSKVFKAVFVPGVHLSWLLPCT